ncbi:MAG: DUF4010 domain-containing protein [Rhodospirillaceae bacterium]|nr:DUF4010 domain-containing protein [Rhodospirillaceae bacterium]
MLEHHLNSADVLNFAVALGIGLLIGTERERKKSQRAAYTPGGVRTFPIVALSGAIAFFLGGAMLLAVAAAGTFVLAAIGYARTREAGIGVTSETALVLTVLLGGLAITTPALAAGLAVTVTALLAARSPLHHFVARNLTNYELRDGLIFGVATLVILPILPDRHMGPFEALNPQSIWVLVILIMAVGAVGHVATRVVGVRLGLPFSGFVTGFISSTAAIGAMGSQFRAQPSLLRPAVAGAVLSTVTTVVYLAIVIGITDMNVLKAMARPLAYAGLAAVAYGLLFTLRLDRDGTVKADTRRRAFSVPMALGLAAMLSGILLVTAAAQTWLNSTGLMLVAGLAGIADTHAAAISVTSLAAGGKLSAQEAVIPIVTGMTTNTLSKLAFATAAGGSKFALRVVPGLLLVIAAAWIGALS